MMQLRLLETALLLGVYVLLAGGYGLAYTLARLNRSPRMRIGAAGLYGSHFLVTIGVVNWAPLGPAWKALLVASSLAILVIPWITWSYLERTHAAERFAHDPERTDRPDRAVARL
jgi:hypothetical protein